MAGRFLRSEGKPIKCGAEKQQRCFEELARDAGCEAKLEAAVKVIGWAKVRDEGPA